MNYRVKNISQPHGADASGAVIFSDNFTPPPVKKSIITGEAEGKVILVGDALVAPPEELHVFGETLQKKTTGAQLFDVSKIEDTWNGEYGIKNNRDGSIYLMAPSNTAACDTRKKLKELCPELLADSVCVINAMTTGESRYIYLRGSNRSIGYGEKTTISNDDLESEVAFYASGINTEATISNIIVAIGETVLPWEPYTGGKPSPSPEYPQDIVNTQTPVQVEVMGGNLWNPYGEKVTGLYWGWKIRPDERISIALYEKNPDVDLGEIFFGTTKAGIDATGGADWIINGYFGTTTDFKVMNSSHRYISLYPNNEKTLETLLNRFDIFVSLAITKPEKYEPYKQPQTITFNTPGGLPGIPVNSNGNYTDAEGQQWLSDSIEYKNEKLMYVQRVETLRLLTDVGSIDSQNGYLNINNFLNADITRRSGSLCTHLTYGDTLGDNVFWIDSSGTGVRIKISKYTTSEEYLSWLAENEVYLTYPCANPIEKEISDSNLINQLKSLRLNSPNTTIMNDANAFQKIKYLKETYIMANVNFRFGTYEQYKALESKDTNTLYFVDGIIYKGDAPYSQKVEMVSAFPETTNAAQGVLYVNSSTYEAKFFNGTDYTIVFVGTVGNMDDAGNDAKVVTQAAVKAYVTKQLADANIPTDSAINEKINTAKEEAITEAVSQAGTAADQKDAALKTQLEQTMDTKIAAQVASVFRFKGSKANKGEIDAIEGMVTGDVWHSEDDGKEYVYDGKAWELLGFTVDLSAYATTAAVTEAINAKAEELTSAIATAKSEAIAAAKAETTSQVNAHAGDKTIHITGEERTAWNAKADTSYVDSAKQAAITAAASDATTKANQALTDAKAYTDQKNSAMDTRMKAVEAAVTWGEIA